MCVDYTILKYYINILRFLTIRGIVSAKFPRFCGLKNRFLAHI